MLQVHSSSSSSATPSDGDARLDRLQAIMILRSVPGLLGYFFATQMECIESCLEHIGDSEPCDSVMYTLIGLASWPCGGGVKHFGTQSRSPLPQSLLHFLTALFGEPFNIFSIPLAAAGYELSAGCFYGKLGHLRRKRSFSPPERTEYVPLSRVGNFGEEQIKK